MPPPRIVLVTDPRYEDALLLAKLDAALSAAPKGLALVQLRDKSRSSVEVFTLARALRALTHEHGAPFVVNDRLDIALAVGADGAHLGKASVGIEDARKLLGASAFLSVAAHDLADIERASREGADAALLSPIFPSPGKGEPLGASALAEARSLAGPLLVYALGGVGVAQASACIEAGASGVALIRALFDADDPAQVMRSLVEALGPAGGRSEGG